MRSLTLGLLGDGLRCELHELVVKLRQLLEIGVVDSAQLLEELQSFPLFELCVYVFYILLILQLLIAGKGAEFNRLFHFPNNFSKFGRGGIINFLK